jgi:hypothetical protein
LIHHSIFQFNLYLYSVFFLTIMNASGKARPDPNDAYSGSHSNERPPSPTSAQDEELEYPLGGDIEKSSSLEDNTMQTKYAPTEGPDPAAFPDGGFEAWLVIAGCFCTAFASFGWINCKMPSATRSTCFANLSITRHWYFPRLLPVQSTQSL